MSKFRINCALTKRDSFDQESSENKISIAISLPAKGLIEKLKALSLSTQRVSLLQKRLYQ